MFYSKGQSTGTVNNFKFQKRKSTFQKEQTSGSVKNRLAMAKEPGRG